MEVVTPARQSGYGEDQRYLAVVYMDAGMYDVSVNGAAPITIEIDANHAEESPIELMG